MTKRFWKSGPAENSFKIGFLRLLVISLVAFGVSTLMGCLVPSQETLKKPSWPAQQPRTSESGERLPEQALVKPFIPPESEPGSGPRSEVAQLTKQDQSPKIEPSPETKSEQTTPAPGQPTAASSGPAPREPAKSSTKTWEDEKVRALALELAKDSPASSKIKICYAVTKDEWWVILYEDTGSAFELKQYTWNRNDNKLEPFLVFKTVPKDRIEEHLKSAEPDRACEVLETPKKED
jgi:hypothetical protein